MIRSIKLIQKKCIITLMLMNCDSIYSVLRTLDAAGDRECDAKSVREYANFSSFNLKVNTFHSNELLSKLPMEESQFSCAGGLLWRRNLNTKVRFNVEIAFTLNAEMLSHSSPCVYVSKTMRCGFFPFHSNRRMGRLEI